VPRTGNGERSRQTGHAPDSGRRCITDEQRAAPLGGLATSAHGRCSWRCLAMLIAFAWLTWYPFWVLLVVAVSVAVISALTARGRDAATPVQLSGSHAGRVVLTGVAGG